MKYFCYIPFSVKMVAFKYCEGFFGRIFSHLLFPSTLILFSSRRFFFRWICQLGRIPGYLRLFSPIIIAEKCQLWFEKIPKWENWFDGIFYAKSEKLEGRVFGKDLCLFAFSSYSGFFCFFIPQNNTKNSGLLGK